MKKTRYIVLMVLLMAAGSGCNKMLDIKPVNSMIPVSISDYESVLMGGYPKQDFFMNMELLTDNVYANFNSPYSPTKSNEAWFTWAPTTQADGETTDPYWGLLYKAIFCANTVLDEFAVRTPSADERELYEIVKGEAHALRAFSYFYLVNMYAEPYASGTLQSYGVPMPLSAKEVSENTQHNTREPLEKVWAQILTDLDSAAVSLTGKLSRNKFRFDAISVKLLASRVHLFMGDYEKAIAAATDVINAKPLFNMNLLQAHIDEKGERYAFTSNYGMIDSDYKNEVMFFVGGKANGNMFYHAWNLFKPSPELLQLCQKDGMRDYRRYIFASFADPNTGDGVQTGPTVYNMFAKQENPSYYIGLKASEAYLIRAEAYARTGRPAKAVADLNALLANRIHKNDFKPLQAGSFNEAQLLQRVLEERRIELALDGGLRWFDLRRLGKPALSHVFKNGQLYQLQQGDPRYVLQIPLSEQINSPDMPLNPR